MFLDKKKLIFLVAHASLLGCRRVRQDRVRGELVPNEGMSVWPHRQLNYMHYMEYFNYRAD